MLQMFDEGFNMHPSNKVAYVLKELFESKCYQPPEICCAQFLVSFVRHTGNPYPHYISAYSLDTSLDLRFNYLTC